LEAEERNDNSPNNLMHNEFHLKERQKFICSDFIKPLNALLEKRQIAGIALFIPRASGNSY